ncbi:Glyoxylate/hydroxypyruvate reductase HPR3-like, partial [Thalictrum thalictroides]
VGGKNVGIVGIRSCKKALFHTFIIQIIGREGVVNVGRGALIIEEEELVRSLLQREIKGVGLDVFGNEPDVPKELLELDNVVLSPHKAVLTPESFSSLHELVITNLEAFFFNKPLLS